MKVVTFQFFILTEGFHVVRILSFFSVPSHIMTPSKLQLYLTHIGWEQNYCLLPSLVSRDCHKSLPAKVLLLRKLLAEKFIK